MCLLVLIVSRLHFPNILLLFTRLLVVLSVQTLLFLFFTPLLIVLSLQTLLSFLVFTPLLIIFSLQTLLFLFLQNRLFVLRCKQVLRLLRRRFLQQAAPGRLLGTIAWLRASDLCDRSYTAQAQQRDKQKVSWSQHG